MATGTVNPNKTSFTVGEQITVDGVVTGLAPAVAPVTTQDVATGHWELSDGTVIDAQSVPMTITKPGKPAQTVVSFTVTSPNHIWAQVDADTWKTTA